MFFSTLLNQIYQLAIVIFLITYFKDKYLKDVKLKDFWYPYFKKKNQLQTDECKNANEQLKIFIEQLQLQNQQKLELSKILKQLLNSNDNQINDIQIQQLKTILKDQRMNLLQENQSQKEIIKEQENQILNFEQNIASLNFEMKQIQQSKDSMLLQLKQEQDDAKIQIKNQFEKIQQLCTVTMQLIEKQNFPEEMNDEGILQQLEKNLYQIQSEKEERKNEIINLKQKILYHENEFKIYEQEKQKLEFIDIKEDSENRYDIMIQMKSLFELENCPTNKQNTTNGLRIKKINKQINNDLKNIIIVGLLGLRKIGKTFLLNLLINEQFPSAYNVSTPGLCMKQHTIQNKQVLYVDSEGLNNPASMDFQNNPIYQQIIENKKNLKDTDHHTQQQFETYMQKIHFDVKAVEQIQQEFIIKNSNILIIVVAQVTLEDQKFINTISKKFFDNEQQIEKKLIVVHNLKEFHQKKSVENYICQMKNNFTVQDLLIDSYEQQNGEDYFNTIFYDEVKSNINHLVLANQNSEAGRFYNKFALYFIKQQISTYQDLSNFNIQDKFQQHLNQMLPYYVQHNYQQHNDVRSEKKDFLEYSEKDEKIVLKPGIKITKIKEHQVDIYGSIQKDFQYSIVNENDNKKHLLIEIPGTSKFTKKFDKQKGEFRLKVIQNKDIENSLGEICATTRRFDEKTYKIQICREKEYWKYHRDEDKSQNGVYKFTFTKEEKDEFS